MFRFQTSRSHKSFTSTNTNNNNINSSSDCKKAHLHCQVSDRSARNETNRIVSYRIDYNLNICRRFFHCCCHFGICRFRDSVKGFDSVAWDFTERKRRRTERVEMTTSQWNENEKLIIIVKMIFFII